MVNFCIRKALENKATSYYKLRRLVYNEWKASIIQHTSPFSMQSCDFDAGELEGA
ncbi:hypothetical protein KEJ19_03440 [Candidatus Bathyarchaeota archaeon]|nr:hypothetical protein [Candidatus Bathyarchaeota archaeon]